LYGEATLAPPTLPLPDFLPVASPDLRESIVIVGGHADLHHLYPTYAAAEWRLTGLELAAAGHEISFHLIFEPIASPDQNPYSLSRSEDHRYPLFRISSLRYGFGNAHGRGVQIYELDLLHVNYAIPNAVRGCLAKRLAATHQAPLQFVTPARD